MRSFTRGERAKISDLSNRTRRFEVLLNFCCASIPVFDFVCFATDAQNQLSDDRYMIFFNQRCAPDASISLDELQDQNARFSVDLDALPPHIERLTFTVSPENSGRMNQVAVSFVTLREADVAGADAIASYRFSGDDFGDEGSLLLAEIYKKGGEWRFSAIGQGFVGNLGALLQHFGGQETEASAGNSAPLPLTPPNLPPAPPKQPSPPISSPALVSIVVTPPPVAAFNPQNALQRIIDGAPSGSTLQLSRGEFQGPILITRPLILEGQGAVIWAQNGPVVRVSSAGVTLRDLEIEATAPDSGEGFDVALWIEDDTNAILQKVRVRGEIRGVSQVQGQWKLPPLLNLGEFAAREANEFEFEIEVPHACDLKSSIAGVSIVPPRVEAGRSRVELRLNGIGNDTFLAGHVELSSGGIGRTIPLHGHGAEGAQRARGISLWRVDNSVDNAPNPA